MGFSGISLTQLLIIAVIVLLVFGAKRLKNIGSELGDGLKSFRKAFQDDDTPPPPPPPPSNQLPH